MSKLIKWFFWCVYLLIGNITYAQETDTIANNKLNTIYKLSGIYGGAHGGICLFDDGKFLLYGYATAIFGDYQYANEMITFTPEKPNPFEVYAHQNKSIRSGARINFIGFEENQTFVRFDQDSLYRVFNEGANCFEFPYVHQIKICPKTVEFRQLVEDFNGYGATAETTMTYALDSGYNDFIFIYNAPVFPSEKFSVSVEKNSENILSLSGDYLGTDKFSRREEGEAYRQDWEDLLAIKENHFRKVAADDYTFDETKNQFIHRTLPEQQYHEEPNILKEYIKLQSLTSGKGGDRTQPVASESIFYTICDYDVNWKR
ncbi:hypothetical protein H8S90_14165 [Olivibacter sp. SDN3]|uniref:hypothetical protein n=1 Tax=Olivibacter sp. SDN3 TaxID=2764720 RepID=UPI001650E977|nr:hypothetical protein [Olivibacter sp. SDN3]QNL47960.1 hypothetical protein H8S90_14165 [Olivibacter sp. SDN3]